MCGSSENLQRAQTVSPSPGAGLVSGCLLPGITRSGMRTMLLNMAAGAIGVIVLASAWTYHHPRLNYHGQEIQGWIEVFFFLGRAWRKSKAGWKDGGGREWVKESNKRFQWQKIGLRSMPMLRSFSTWVWEGGIKNSVIFKHDHHFGEIMRVLNAGWQTHTLTRSFLPRAYMKDNTSFNYRDGDMSDDENSPAMSFLSNTLAN